MNRAIWRVSVTASPEAEEAIAELFRTVFGQPGIVYQDFETGKTNVSVFLRDRGHFAKHKGDLAKALRRIRDCGLEGPIGKLTCQKLRNQDWAESWKRHFRPIEIGRRLLIKPSWSRKRTKTGQATIVLDPGLSFGTGQHPTTGFCLRELARSGPQHPKGGFLDAGTGSGILAIAAAKLEFNPVDAFDFDADALRIAQGNARRNNVTRRIRFSRQDATKFRSGKNYSVICANLSTEVLQRVVGRLASCLQHGGVLVLAGILKNEFGAVEGAAAKLGLRLTRKRDEKEWRSGTFRWECQRSHIKSM